MFVDVFSDEYALYRCSVRALSMTRVMDGFDGVGMFVSVWGEIFGLG